MILQTRHFVFAILLHAILLAFLLVSVECSNKDIEAPPVVQGTLIKPSDIPKPSVPAQEAPTPPKPDALPDQGPQQKVVADTQGDEARVQREKQEAADKQAEEQKKQAAELQKQQEEAQKAAEAEKQRQEAAKQEELRQQQIALDKQKADEQAKAEAARKKLEDEQRKKQEEAQKQAEAKKQQEAAAAELKKQLEQEAQQQQSAMHERQKAEQAKRDALERKRLAEEVQKQAGQEYGKVAQATWIDQLSAAIHQAWAKPPGTDMSIRCKVRLQIGPTGQVQASIVSPSGNQLFDNSVLSAVYKAQPLPLPDDPSLLNQGIVLTFTPAS